MQLLASPRQAAERLIPQPPCPVAGWMAQSDPLLLFHTHTNTNTVSTSLLYERGTGGRGLHSLDIAPFCAHPHSHFTSPHWSACQCLPMSFTLSTLSAITLLFIRLHPSVSALMKWFEWNYGLVFMREPLERTSLWHCNRNTGFLT